MKVLILSVSAGGGHSHAAEAVQSYIKINEPNAGVKIIDTLKQINPIIDKVIIGGYLNSLKITPSLFGKLYDYAETDYGLATVSNKINELMAYKLLPLVQQYDPDVVICTHPFPLEMMSILKLKDETTLPLISILTDYAPHSFWLHPRVDAYIVSNSDMIDEMVSRGIERNCIFDFGIPVKPNFISNYDKNQTLTELNLSIDKTTLLIMGGSLGIGKISDIYQEIATIDRDIQIIVITGNNKKLFSELSKLQLTSSKPTRIIGYTDEVNKYMQCCDLLLTKPGGLTITEALICNIPLALFCPIPGQEEKNAEFLLKHNLAVDLGNGKNCKNIIEDLLFSVEKLNEMRENSSQFSKPSSGHNIYNLILSLCKKNKNQ